MRNLVEYPLTKTEVTGELKALIDECDGIGGLRPVILKQFLAFMEATPEDLVQFLFEADPSWDTVEVSNDQ